MVTIFKVTVLHFKINMSSAEAVEAENFYDLLIFRNLTNIFLNCAVCDQLNGFNLFMDILLGNQRPARRLN